jgi:hypothetical protein
MRGAGAALCPVRRSGGMWQVWELLCRHVYRQAACMLLAAGLLHRMWLLLFVTLHLQWSR